MGAQRWSTAAALAGAGLGALFGAAAVVRRGRPLHPRGRTRAGRVERTGAATGVPWLDESGPADVLVRVSRAMGLPSRLPDIYGMALRVGLPGQGTVGDSSSGASPCADLLFASTGESALGRFVLRLRSTAGSGPLTTLLPVRVPAGPLLLRLAPLDAPAGDHLTPPARMSLSYALGTGQWLPLGTLQIGAEVSGHEDERHDPVVHQLPGQEQYRWVARLREPAYRAARRLGPLTRDRRHLPHAASC